MLTLCNTNKQYLCPTHFEMWLIILCLLDHLISLQQKFGKCCNSWLYLHCVMLFNHLRKKHNTFYAVICDLFLVAINICGLQDVQELRRDEERCQEFVQLCATLKLFAGDFPLPSNEELLENFGKVGT